MQIGVRPHAGALIGGVALAALMALWAVQDGGYDASTWYWGALLLLAAAAGLGFARRTARMPRAVAVALGALALYVAWSFLSISWAQSPGDALQGSNRALLYLLLFLVAALIPWTPEATLATLTTFALAIGAIAVVMLLRLASADQLHNVVVNGRFLAPTGYFNATSALFTMGALVGSALAAQRRLPGPLRGLLLALASADLQLAVIGQSRGWLFTLPLVLLASIVVVRDRVRVAVTSIVPAVATVIPVHRLLAIYPSDFDGTLNHAAARAGQTALLLCAGALVLGTLGAWVDTLFLSGRGSARSTRALGAILAAGALAAGVLGATAATHGHPVAFVKRQWHGFSNASPPRNKQSNFAVVGSGRYDFWRVSLDAFAAHPIGGLGQDNFSDYYVSRRRTAEEPQWTHSLEMRLLAHTGVVGFVMFTVFLVAATAAAFRSRRSRDPFAGSLAAIAVLPFVVWLIHGSVDWFWEMPALTGPALAFLAMAGGVGRPQARRAALETTRRWPRLALGGGALVATLAAAVVLGFPYLSARETSSALAVRSASPSQALSHLSKAADLNPLSPLPGRLGGAIALQAGQFADAERRFRQAIAREPDGWFSWLGAGLAASALGDRRGAHDDFLRAKSLNSKQPAVVQALARVNSRHPLSASQAFGMLVIVK